MNAIQAYMRSQTLIYEAWEPYMSSYMRSNPHIRGPRRSSVGEREEKNEGWISDLAREEIRGGVEDMSRDIAKEISRSLMLCFSQNMNPKLQTQVPNGVSAPRSLTLNPKP
jgi:hypothetical protein